MSVEASFAGTLPWSKLKVSGQELRPNGLDSRRVVSNEGSGSDDPGIWKQGRQSRKDFPVQRMIVTNDSVASMLDCLFGLDMLIRSCQFILWKLSLQGNSGLLHGKSYLGIVDVEGSKLTTSGNDCLYVEGACAVLPVGLLGSLLFVHRWIELSFGQLVPDIWFFILTVRIVNRRSRLGEIGPAPAALFSQEGGLNFRCVITLCQVVIFVLAFSPSKWYQSS
ncbi:hypothetical protein V8G54_034273 [Vigna mungo]|uniref:Uncharacterized protein n=1 Tax=Vigna mungo TaxID=3915 RepID=A0AAQ3RKL5_VIGMU